MSCPIPLWNPHAEPGALGAASGPAGVCFGANFATDPPAHPTLPWRARIRVVLGVSDLCLLLSISQEDYDAAGEKFWELAQVILSSFGPVCYLEDPI